MTKSLKKHYIKRTYTPHQDFLYNRALFGLSMYTPDEVVIMAPEKRKRILKTHKKVQKILNLWKQEIVNTLANKFFTDLFPDMEITKSLIQLGTQGDSDYINNMSFKSLKINKEQIIEKLIRNKILPKNFNELKQEQHENRISSKRRPVSGIESGKCIGRRITESFSKAG